jgi:hypothetical protein
MAAMRECIALHFDEHVAKRRVLLKDAANRSDYTSLVVDEWNLSTEKFWKDTDGKY